MKSEIVVSRDADLNRAHRATRAAHCRLCYLGAGADDGRGSVFEASYCLQYGALWSLPRNPHYSCLEGRRHAVRRHPQKATQATERSRTSNLSLTKRSRSLRTPVLSRDKAACSTATPRLRIEYAVVKVPRNKKREGDSLRAAALSPNKNAKGV